MQSGSEQAEGFIKAKKRRSKARKIDYRKSALAAIGEISGAIFFSRKEDLIKKAL